jgi:hypothetical protein
VIQAENRREEAENGATEPEQRCGAPHEIFPISVFPETTLF